MFFLFPNLVTGYLLNLAFEEAVSKSYHRNSIFVLSVKHYCKFILSSDLGGGVVVGKHLVYSHGTQSRCSMVKN
jgi:hypothetical protein